MISAGELAAVLQAPTSADVLRLVAEHRVRWSPDPSGGGELCVDAHVVDCAEHFDFWAVLFDLISAGDVQELTEDSADGQLTIYVIG